MAPMVADCWIALHMLPAEAISSHSVGDADKIQYVSICVLLNCQYPLPYTIETVGKAISEI